MDDKTKIQFLSAVFYSDLDKIREIVGQPDFDKGILEDIHIFNGTKIPIIYLTAAQREIFRDAQDWANGHECFILAQRCAELVWNFWRDEMHLDMVIDYHSIAEPGIMYVSDEFDTDEDILGMPVETALAKGFREIDIRLYIACHRLDAKQVAYLMEQGANPDVYFTGDESDTARDRIAAEASLMDVEVYPLYDISPSERYCNIREIEFFKLLNFGAHEQIYNLIHGHGFID